MTVLSPGRHVVRGALLRGCALMVSPAEGKITPDRLTVLADTLKWVSGFVAGRVLSLAVDFVLTTFIGLRRLATMGGYTHSVYLSLDRQVGVACIEVTNGWLGSAWATLGAGKPLCTICLALTTILAAGCLVVVSASLGGCEGWISPQECETARLGCRFGLMSTLGLRRSAAVKKDGLNSSFDGRDGCFRLDTFIEGDRASSFRGREGAACIEEASD
jgi:hypothetical protein